MKSFSATAGRSPMWRRRSWKNPRSWSYARFCRSWTGEETPEELEQKKKEQAKKNIQAMAKSLLFDNAAATAKLLPLLYEPDVDENGVVENIGPFKKMRAVKELLNNDDVMDFLLWCLPLVLAGTDA